MERELLHKYFEGKATRDEEKRVMDWAGASDENRREYLRERMLWDALLLHPGAVRGGVPARLRWHSFGSALRWAAVAAAFAGLVAGAWVLLGRGGGGVPPTVEQVSSPVLLSDAHGAIDLDEKSFAISGQSGTIRNDHRSGSLSYTAPGKDGGPQAPAGRPAGNRLLVPHGQTYRLALADGTEVVLNSGSELSFPSRFAVGRREVALKGEAFFRVARKEDAPFVVHAGPLDVRVLGTVFNVSSYGGSGKVEATLVEGSVRVEQDGGARLISPGQQYVYDPATGGRSVREVDTALYTSWTRGEYIFRGSTLDEVFARLSHWYRFDAPVYDDPSLRAKRFTFSIGREATLDQVIHFINTTEEVRIERDNLHIHVKKNCPEMNTS